MCEHGDPESDPDGGGFAPPIPDESDFAAFDIPPSTPPDRSLSRRTPPGAGTISSWAAEPR